MSMKPGAIMHPAASTTWAASPASAGPMAVTRSPDSATSARRPGAPVPSRTVPPRISQSKATGASGPPRVGRGGPGRILGQGLGSSIFTLFILSPGLMRSTTSRPEVTWPKTV